MSGYAARGAVRLTVVIPVKDDARHLERCLEAVARQTHRPDEVIVVDNASRDDSAEVARRSGARVVHEPSPGIPAAASTGYDAVAGGVIVRCDADTLPPPDWLERIHAAFVREPDMTALTGPGRFYDLPGARARITRVFYMRGYFWGMRAALANVPLWGSNMAFRASAWQEVRDRVHRDDPHVHDDADLSFQLGSGARVRYDGRLVVGVSGRTFESADSLGRRFRWAWHTLAVNWAVSPPWERWAARITERRRGGRDRSSRTAP
ncbi:glycosyltransferase family 2 protein [Oerskovia gallyi]|uniref:glycosyltransferase family 2 protein n=1 Tax=Oerskovia gallyi TaxID=2762226 RepID=UPI00296AB932|nr:glycosyltransferase family 2 protein [Oerskovia gallyi]